MAALVLLSLLAQYPLELPPVRPSMSVLWMVLPAVAQDLPAAPTGQPVKVGWVFFANTATGQAQADQRCAAAIAQNNTVYGADPLNHTPMQLVGCLYYAARASTTMSVDLTCLQNGTDCAPIRTWRDQVHADLVQAASVDTNACGLGYIGAAAFGKQWGYSVVQWPCTAFGQFSDSHEMGHNFGMCHDDGNATTCTPSQPYGYGWIAADQHRDPMAYGSGRLPFFGDPTRIVNGQPWGNATHDGARLMRWAMPIVANFYPPVKYPSILTQLTAVQ